MVQCLPQIADDVFVNLCHPVADEQMLVLPGNRTDETNHGINPRGVFCLDAEFGVGTVLAAAIGDAAVDDHDLACVWSQGIFPGRIQSIVIHNEEINRP